MAVATNTLGAQFDVFLCFRGPDTRPGFTSYLYHDMYEKVIRVFKDDRELKPGEPKTELLRALEESQIYIPIFSPKFASSSWCLRELTHMVRCTSDPKGKKKMLPIFLDVTTKDVALETELYTADLNKHDSDHPSEVHRWREALRRVPSKIGWEVEGGDWGALIKSIVRRVQLELKVKNRILPDHLVETDDLEDIEELLDVDSADHVRFVILHGTGGIGKSTLAGFIFNQFRSKFKYSSFLEMAGCHDPLEMQKKLLSETLGLTSTHGILHTNDGKHKIKEGLHNKKVLVVLDNVDKEEQLKNLVGSYDWFNSGSRIIATVRDEGTIPVEIKNRTTNYRSHQVKEMPLDQAIELFSKHAFTSDIRPKDWYERSKEVILSIGRLPLTLEVVGPLFAPNNGLNWNDTLDDLKEVPNEKVREKLMISLKKLDPTKMAIFLEIACFCIGEDTMKASYMWGDHIYPASSTAIKGLCDRSLIKIDKNKFWMHDELRDLGRCIVMEENLDDYGKRRWVHIDDNTLDILTGNEQKDVRALSLGNSHKFKPEELAHFPKLRFLGGEGMNFEGHFEDSLSNLRWLSWHNCSLKLGETTLYPKKLVVLDLSQSNITHDWDGWNQIKAKKLKVLDLTCCKELTKTPNLSKFGNLEKLILAGCLKLSAIDSSIGQLKQLHTLNIDGCVSLEGLPEEIGSLELLSEIIMPSRGDKPFNLPQKLGNLKSLKKFEVRDHNGISQLPDSIGRLTNLTHLLLSGCKSLLKLPNSIGNLKSLVELDLERSEIRAIPESIGNLKRLKVIRVGHTKIETIPRAIREVEMLEELHAQHCFFLEDKFPEEMRSLTHLRILDLDWTRISTMPTSISGCTSLQTLIITSQFLQMLPKLPSSLKCLVVSPAQFPVLPDLSSLVHLNQLEVWRRDPTNSAWRSKDPISPWQDVQFIHQLPRRLSTLKLGWIPQLPNFSDFQILSVLTIDLCPMPHFPVLEKLEILRELSISSCRSLKNTPDLSRLEWLQKLLLSDLPELVEIPGLGELKSLKFLHIAECNVIRQLPNLSKLIKLRYLKLDDCEELRAVQGLKEMKFLKKVEIKQCKSLESLPDLPIFTELDTD